MKTLVIDTDRAIMDAVSAIFCKKGGCDWAEDGEKGLDMIKSAFKQGQPYDLIVLEIVLPEVSGYTIIKEVRNLELNMNISPIDEVKIIVLTYRSDEPTLLQAFRNGATGWVSKPIDPTALEAKINKLHWWS